MLCYLSELKDGVVAGIAGQDDLSVEFVGSHGIRISLGDFVQDLEYFECLLVVLEIEIDVLHKFSR